MKRYNGLHDKLCTIENIEVADDNARKNKIRNMVLINMIKIDNMKMKI
jgi:hypothetical protein